MPFVKFHAIDKNPALRQKTKLRQFIKYIFSSEIKKLDSIDFVFCSDAYLLSLNQQFLQHDYFTDILTFDLSKDCSAITGEVYISIDRVKENAITNNVSYLNEINRVIFHGTLHLCGYLDKTEREKELMTQKENFYLAQFEVFHVEIK